MKTSKLVGFGLLLGLCGWLFMGASWAPFTGGWGSGTPFSVTVTRAVLDTNWVLCVEDTGFAQAQVDTFIKVKYNGSSGDTAYVWLQGIGTDSTHVDTLLKVNGGSTVTTARKFYAYESAWLDSDEASSVNIWSASGTMATAKLDSIVAGTLWRPNAQRLFGKRDRAVLEKFSISMPAALQHYFPRHDSLLWSNRGNPSVICTLIGVKRDTIHDVVSFGNVTGTIAYKLDRRQGTPGGTFVDSMFSQFSNDGILWGNVQASGTSVIVFSNSSSADRDTLLSLPVAGSARFQRMVYAQTTAGVADTTILTVARNAVFAISAQQGPWIEFDVRVYPTLKDTRDTTPGYVSHKFLAQLISPNVQEFPLDLTIPPYSYVQVWARSCIKGWGGATVTLKGKRRYEGY